MNFDDFVKIALRDIRVSYRDAFNEWACSDGNKMIEYLEKVNDQTEALIKYLKEQNATEQDNNSSFSHKR